MVPTFDDRITAHNEKLGALDVFKNTEHLDKKIQSIKQLSESLNGIVKDKE